MRILYFSFEYPPFFVGGLGTYAYEMSRRFARRGHSVTVFAKNPGNVPTSDLEEGVEVHRPLTVDATDLLPLIVPEDVKHWPPHAQSYFAEAFIYNILSSTKVCNQLVRAEQRTFDLIVAHDWISGIAGITCKKDLKRPFVFHLHSVEEGRVGDGSPTVKSLERLAAKTAEVVITVSYAMRDQLISLGYEERKIRVIYNGVDEQKYDPSKVAEEEVRELREKLGVGADPMILFVGRLSWVKGADTLVRAMPLILSEVPSAKLVLLGKGEQEKMLRDLIRQLGVEKSVITEFQYVSERERILHYAAADVAVFPSKYEPFGIVATEAMSMGKPVVVGAKGVSGFREQVIHSGPERCGAHVNPDDPYDIAKFTVELLKDEKLRRELGRNARKRVLEKFTFDLAADNTLMVYEQVLQNHSPR
jgi:glycosyltransferase involved in cell wall biosynthesis